MITIFTTPSSLACRKAKAWLQKNDITYNERNIYAQPLSVEEIKEVLRKTEGGTDEIISTRSKKFKDLNVDINNTPLNELCKIIQENPDLLRRPIIFDHKNLHAGYNEEEMGRFLPRKVRNIQLWRAISLIN
ncbi:Spx/MgsR family RNA polymerase-binding regulatory protein [Peribacillus cavernae]|uniref:Spx/MgsR family RNA polymerase-binding regulatory protein n=1 Tax=Peribacillus cavernae TaxID=1674310 RepID=A0A433HE53_9BACI|nr:transcriptional regulator Spx [Peribacillus cavernae]MDQ0219925.1 regulatory protein spx [Peribacillus cavernae]RUQ26595.1 Spx/MgsR family RNA polymerase-binding regulatory protein [Peribacillus cavernae]